MSSEKSLEQKAISIKGKKYILVSDRVLYFNETYTNGSIVTDYTLENDTYVVKAVVRPDLKNADRYFTGMSQATIGDGMVNKTAALENAETSAVGRALGMMGIGVIESIASADELNKATGSSGARKATDKQIKWVRDTAARVYGLNNQEEIDKAIESLLTVKVQDIPLQKIKAAVDKIEADKPEKSSTVINIDGEQEFDLNDLPY